MTDLRMQSYLGLPEGKLGKAYHFRELEHLKTNRPLDVVVAIRTRYREGLKFLKLAKPVSIKTQLDY